MGMHESRNETGGAPAQTHGWAVYQCVNGCVHLRLNHVTLTFSAGEFAQLAQLIGDPYVRLGGRAAGAKVTPH
jgi:hypothetical protein